MSAQIAAFRYAMPDYNVTHEDLIVGTDRVAVRNTVSGTRQGAQPRRLELSLPRKYPQRDSNP